MADNTVDAREIQAFEDIDGHECLVDPRALRPSEAVKVAGLLKIQEGEEFSFDQVGPLVEIVEERYLADEGAYQEIFRSRGLTGVIELVVAWVGELVGATR